MTRYSSAVVISVLGLSVAHGCTSSGDDDTIPNGSGGTAPTSTTTGGIIGGNGGTGTDASNNGGNGGTSGGTGDSDVLDACPDLVDQLPCGADGLSSEKKEVHMLLVLDKSGSMDDDDSNGNNKWNSMKSALRTALREVENDINFGVSLYPYPESPDGSIGSDCGIQGNCCEMPSGDSPQVPIQAGQGSEQVTMVLDALDGTGPGGGTPTSVALEKAYNYFTTGAGSDLSGDKFVLLATDGGPNCNAGLTCGADLCTENLDGNDCTGDAPQGNCCDETYAGDGSGCVDDNNVIDQIDALRSENIDTFVVGIPGSEAYEEFLNAFAVAGDRPASGDYDYYRVDDVEDLTQVMRQITVALVNSCDIEVENPTMQRAAPELAIDCELVPRLSGGGGSDGGGMDDNWTWDADSNTIEVQGDLCNQIETEGVGRVDVIFNCGGVR